MTAFGDVYGFHIDSAGARRWHQAMALARQHNFSAAADELRQLLAGQRGFVPAMVQAAHFLRMQDHYRDAVALSLEAAQCAPMVAGLAVELGKLLRHFECPGELGALFERTRWDTAGSAREVVEAARLLAESGLHDPALALLDHAERIEPDYAHQHYIRGSLLAAAGDMPGARAQLKRAIALAPTSGHAYWMLSMLADRSDAGEAESQVSAIQGLIGNAQPGTPARAYLEYGLHNWLHRLGQHDKAWAALEQGMRARRAQVPYHGDQVARLFDALHALEISALPDAAPPQAGSPKLIFIVGMHRSGTTLLERILAGHSQVRDGGESYAFTAQLRLETDHYCSQVVDTTTLERIARADLGRVADGFRAYARWRAAGRAVLTEKLPGNFLLAGLIARALPEARILHMRRDPADTCFSNLRTFFGSAAAYSYDPLDVAGYYLRYRNLMSHWHRVVPGRILDVDYACLVADPEGQSRRIMDFCGLPYEPGLLDVGRSGGVVATASIGSIRSGILKDRGGTWLPYARQLEGMIQALEPAYREDGLQPPA